MDRSYLSAMTVCLWCVGMSAHAQLAPNEVVARIKKAEPFLGESVAALEEVYKDLHSHPELSNQEVRTAGKLAERMREWGFEVTEKVGGTGLVCVLKNGPGKTVMVRTDMDALPVTEKTGLDYASKVQVRNADGNVVGVMHACGHDMHMTCWLGAARTLAKFRDFWSGTLVFIAQPAEELGSGAKAMLDDGLFEKFPKPDAGVALHCEAFLPVGSIGHTEGYALANVDSVDIIVQGRGGHGAYPQATIDPIVIAARIVLDLQTIISREIDPQDAAVITVGSIHGGTKRNIIPPEVKLELTVRSFQDETRVHLLQAIERVAKAAAAVAGAPEPQIIRTPEFTPATYNDPELTRATVDVLSALFGQDRLSAEPPMMGGEDYSYYSRAGVPCVMLRLGTIDPRKSQAAKEGKLLLPSLHSDMYAPVPAPSIRTGVTTLTAAVLRIVGK